MGEIITARAKVIEIPDRLGEFKRVEQSFWEVDDNPKMPMIAVYSKEVKQGRPVELIIYELKKELITDTFLSSVLREAKRYFVILQRSLFDYKKIYESDDLETVFRFLKAMTEVFSITKRM